MTCRYYNFVMDSARWERFVFRDDDIVISTPAKSGTTWTQRLCSLVLGVEPTPARPLAVISPWLDMLTRPLGSVIADLEAQSHRRFIKTHTPLDGLPWDDRVTYVGCFRDPRDVAVSWGHHMDNIDGDRFLAARADAVGLDDLTEVFPDGAPDMPSDDWVTRFWSWVEASPVTAQNMGSLKSTLHHLETFWQKRGRPNVTMLHYSDMQADLAGSVRTLAAGLGVEVDDERVAVIAAEASFAAMRAKADHMTPNTDGAFWKDTAGFFRSGSSGQWREFISSEADAARYRASLEALGGRDMIEWVHRGGTI